MRRWTAPLRHLFPEDVAAILFMALYLCLSWAYAGEMHITRILARHYLYTFAIIIGLSVLSGRSDKHLLRVLRNWLPLFVVYIIFENLQDLIHRVNPHDMDPTLIAIDRWVFGVDVTVWMEQFVNPWLTDWLHAAYTSFFMIPPTVAGILYARGQYKQFRDFGVATILACYIGYLGYILVPAVGPRFAQADLYHFGMKGKYITETIRYTLDMLEPTRRDCFPSLHTCLTAIATWTAWTRMRPISYILMPVSFSLFLATVYGRYHYVVDVAAGFLLAAFCLWLSPRLNVWWYKHVTPKPVEDYFPKPILESPRFKKLSGILGRCTS